MGLNDGLIGLWHYSNDFNDSSGEGNNWSNSGTVFTSDKNGVSNQAVDFDGSNDTMSQSGSFMNLATGTLSTWLNPDITGTQYIISHRNTGDDIIYIYIEAGEIKATFGATTIVSGVIVDTSSYYHIVLTWDSSSGIKLVVNAVEKATGTYTHNQVNTTLYFGSYKNSLFWYDGQGDEVRLYDRVLSSDEISTLYSCYDSCDAVAKPNSLFFGGGF